MTEIQDSSAPALRDIITTIQYFEILCRQSAGEIERLTAQRSELIEATSVKIERLRAALADAENALSRCYDATEWPADGTSVQEKALIRVRQCLAHETRQEISHELFARNLKSFGANSDGSTQRRANERRVMRGSRPGGAP